MLALFREPTSAEILAGTPRVNNQVRIPYTYNGLTINNSTYEIGGVAMSEAVDSTSEPKAQADGLELYGARKIQLLLQMKGVVRADSLAALHDAIDALNAAFDPVLVSTAFPEGTNPDFVAPLDFDYPTADTDDYSDGLIPMRYYGRATERPVSMTSQFVGLAAPFTINLMVPDPRRYAQDASTASRTGTGTLALDNSLATYASWPTLTITLTGAGGSVSIARPASTGRVARTLTLDLTGKVSTDIVVIDMARKSITLNGDPLASLYDSGDWFDLAPAQSTTLTVSGTLNGTIQAAWRKAYV